MIKDYKSNIDEILKEGQVEGIKLDNIELLVKLFNDGDISNIIFKKFAEYFINNFDMDELFMKCEDLVYNVHLFVNEFLIKTCEIKEFEYQKIKEVLEDSVKKDVDIFGSPNYNDYDKEVIEEYKDYYKEDIKI